MINLINKVKSTFKSAEWRSFHKVALSFLAIALLVVTTACSGSEVAAKTNLENPPAGKITELYKPITPPVGGMNNYSDVDPRVDTAKVEGKADRLVKQAQGLEQKDTNPLKQIEKELDRKGIKARVEDTADRVSQSAKDTAEGVSAGTRKGFANVKENAKSLKDDVESAVKNRG